MMRSKKLVTAILAAASITGGAVSVQADSYEDLEHHVSLLDDQVCTLYLNLYEAEENIGQNSGDITEINKQLDLGSYEQGTYFIGADANGEQMTIGQSLKTLDNFLKQEMTDRDAANKSQGKVIQQINDNLVTSVNAINKNMGEGFAALSNADAVEAQTREDADTKLQENIDNETAARIAGENTLNTRIDQVERDATKGIAKASALAALHPLDYDPNNKLDIAAAGGFYKGENAFALGAFYRPNRNVMLSIGTTISGDDNAYNVGVSFKVGKSGKHSEAGVSTAELYAMIGAMQEKMEQQQKRIEELEANQAK